MLNTTYDAIKAVLKSDPTIPIAERNQQLGALRNGANTAKPESTTESLPRIIRRAEAARRLSCSLRLVDRLAATGVLPKRKLPGRVRASGFLESDLVALVTANRTQKEAT